MIDVLIRYNVDPNIACVDGWTSLCEAAKYNQPLSFEKLLNHGCNPDLPKKWSAYQAALRANADVKIFELLLSQLAISEIPENELIENFKRAIVEDRSDVLDIIVSIYPSFSVYLEKKQTPIRYATPLSVIVDLKESDDVLEATLVHGYVYDQLFKNGPVNVIEEFVEIYQDETLLFEYSVPCKRTRVSGLFRLRKIIWDSGYFPRIADLHPKFEITGLSQETGGWIDKTMYQYLDACPSYKRESSLNRG